MPRHSAPSECVTEEEMEKIANNEMTQDQIHQIETKVASCVNCRRLWSRFWAEYRNKAISA